MIMSIWAESTTGDLLDDYIQNDTNTDLVLAKIPTLFGTSLKATYLGHRAMGLSATQALELMNLDESHIEYWRESNPEFLQFELNNIYRLQTEVATELIRLGFLRNMALFVAKDANLLSRSFDLDSLSKREYDYLMKVRGHYTPSDLLALEKAMLPDTKQEKIVINLSWGDQQQVIEGHTEYRLLEDNNED